MEAERPSWLDAVPQPDPAEVERRTQELIANIKGAERMERDAARFRHMQKGLPLTVVVPTPTDDKPNKMVTVSYGPNPEEGYGEALARAVDAALGVTTPPPAPQAVHADQRRMDALEELFATSTRREWTEFMSEVPSGGFRRAIDRASNAGVPSGEVGK